MCRYAFHNYKDTWACFNCRKGFKKVLFDDYLKQHGKKSRLISDEKLKEIEIEYFNQISTCPECGQRMVNLGKDFKIPKNNKVKEWNRIRILFKIGRSFGSCGCMGFGYVPSSRPTYIEYLTKQQAHFKQMILTSQKDITLEAEKRRDRILYWQARVDAVENELKNLR